MIAAGPCGCNARRTGGGSGGQALDVRDAKRGHQRRVVAAGATAGWRVTTRASWYMSVAIFSRGKFEITGVPSFAAITAFGPLGTIVADTGIFSAAPMSATLIPWFARFTTTRTP